MTVKDHFLLTVIYSIAVGALFGTLWRDTPRERIKHGAFITFCLVGGATAVAWLMALLSRKG